MRSLRRGRARCARIGAGAVLSALAIMTAQAATLDYPPAARDHHVDEYHGVRIVDPYRWMENIDAPATRAWVQAEGSLARQYLDAIPGRRETIEQLRKVWNFERWSPPEHHGKYWFFAHNDGLQNQAVVFVTPDPASSPGRVLLDPNTLSADGTIALRESAVSHDGRYFAYALSEAGSDWQTWHVRNVETGQDLPDQLVWSKAGGASWRKDGSGFYYTRYSTPRPGQALAAANRYEKLYFHALGTPQSADPLVYTRTDDPDWFVGGQVSDDGRYLVIQANHGDQVQNTLLVEDLAQPGARVEPLMPQPDAVYTYIGSVGTTFYVLTDRDAPRYRIVAIDLQEPGPQHWRTVVPEGPDTLQAASLVGGELIAQYLKDAYSVVRRYAPENGRVLGEVALQGFGSAAGFYGHNEDRTTYFSFSSLSTPPSIYRLDVGSGQAALWRQPRLEGFNPADYVTAQVFFRSRDGTRVPMFIVSRRGTAQDGRQPTLLYGYGGFNIPLEPQFSPAAAGWLALGGVYAMANLRGGGEYGRAWHEAGMKTHKQNVFDDFIGAAEYLIAQRWTDPAHLAIWGRSNGGLLVGATEEQRPDLFAAAVAQVGVMDMLRFRNFTVGKGWESDYGSVDNPAEFRALKAYSPVQNVRAGVNYPATLITTGDHDDRVFPAHSFKFAAAMQHADPTGRPILLRIDARAGHGAGKPTGKLIEETADIFDFVRQAIAMRSAAASGT